MENNIQFLKCIVSGVHSTDVYIPIHAIIAITTGDKAKVILKPEYLEELKKTGYFQTMPEGRLSVHLKNQHELRGITANPPQ